MITNLKPYPAYRDSGTPWLGKVPEHWEIVPLYGLARPKKIANCEHRELLSVYLHRGVIRFSDVPDKRTNPTSEDLTKYQAVDPGDFVLNNQQAWRGSVGVSQYAGIVSPAYLVLALTDRLESRFADRLFQDRAMVDQYLICSKGVGSIQRNLYWPYLKRVLVTLPPLPEQTAIVRFLDWADHRIRRVIRARQRRIKLLEEYKQALINQAVTGRIDVRTGKPYPKYKNSGVEWLGKVPEHWEVRRLKQMARTQGGYAFPSEWFTTEGVPVVRMNNLRRGCLDITHAACIPRNLCKEGFALKEGDILYGLSGSVGPTGSLGNYAVVQLKDLPAQLNQRVARIVPISSRVARPFLTAVLQTNNFYDQIIDKTTGTAQFNVSPDDVGRVFVALPPLPEQTAIVEFLDEQAKRIDAAIAVTRREIDLLKEFRTRLIADVVTGKLDVREAAASISDEPGEIESNSEIDALESDRDLNTAKDETTDDE